MVPSSTFREAASCSRPSSPTPGCPQGLGADLVPSWLWMSRQPPGKVCLSACPRLAEWVSWPAETPTSWAANRISCVKLEPLLGQSPGGGSVPEPEEQPERNRPSGGSGASPRPGCWLSGRLAVAWPLGVLPARHGACCHRGCWSPAGGFPTPPEPLTCKETPGRRGGGVCCDSGKPLALALLLPAGDLGAAEPAEATATERHTGTEGRAGQKVARDRVSWARPSGWCLPLQGDRASSRRERQGRREEAHCSDEVMARVGTVRALGTPGILGQASSLLFPWCCWGSSLPFCGGPALQRIRAPSGEGGADPGVGA